MAKPSWIALSKSSGTGGGSVNVTASSNTTSGSRSGSITVQTTSGLTKTVSISQAKKPYAVTFSSEDFSKTFDSASSGTVTFTANFKANWSMETGNGLRAIASSGWYGTTGKIRFYETHGIRGWTDWTSFNRGSSPTSFGVQDLYWTYVDQVEIQVEVPANSTGSTRVMKYEMSFDDIKYTCNRLTVFPQVTQIG